MVPLVVALLRDTQHETVLATALRCASRMAYQPQLLAALVGSGAMVMRTFTFKLHSSATQQRRQRSEWLSGSRLR